MPRSKKGRISGSARKVINERRATDAVAGRAEGVVFARITKIIGAGHVKVAIDSKHGPKEIIVRIPNLLGRRGATPLNTSSVVSVFVGKDFNPDEPVSSSDHFDITAILTQKQAYGLQKDGLIPSWMAQDIDTATTTDAGAGGFEFDYSEKAGEDDSSESETTVPAFSRKIARDAADADVDVDEI